MRKKGYQYGFINEMSKIYDRVLKRKLEPVRRLHQELTGTLESVSTIEKELLNSKEEKIKQINEHFDTLAQLLSQERRSFTDYTEKSFMNKQTLCCSRKREVSEQLVKLESIIEFVETSIHSKSKESFLPRLNDIDREIEQLLSPLLCSYQK